MAARMQYPAFTRLGKLAARHRSRAGAFRAGVLGASIPNVVRTARVWRRARAASKLWPAPVAREGAGARAMAGPSDAAWCSRTGVQMARRLASLGIWTAKAVMRESRRGLSALRAPPVSPIVPSACTSLTCRHLSSLPRLYMPCARRARVVKVGLGLHPTHASAPHTLCSFSIREVASS